MYQMPGLAFLDRTRHHHRDIMQRVYIGSEEDRYLSPWDGHLAKLVVQAAQEVYDGVPNSTWRRTFVRNPSSTYIRLANFPFNNVPANVDLWKDEHWVSVTWKWIPACVGLMFFVRFHIMLSSIPVEAAIMLMRHENSFP
jgi:hypothetical protein